MHISLTPATQQHIELFCPVASIFFLHLTFAPILLNASKLDSHCPLMDPLSFRGIQTCFLREKSSGSKFETELYRMSYTIINYHHIHHHHHRNVGHNHTQS